MKNGIRRLAVVVAGIASVSAAEPKTPPPPGDAAHEKAAAVVAGLLRRPLTIARAVQIALLNNRDLQATFEEIGIAQAGVLDAVTIPNPTIDFEVQFPATPATLNRYAWVVAQEFVQILMIPLRKRVAREALQAEELRVSAQVLDLVANVKKAGFQVLADRQLLARLEVVQETNAAALDLGQRQFEAGNITDLALLQMQSSYGEGRLAVSGAEADLEAHREDLNALLGLWGGQTDWEMNGELPPVDDDLTPARGLESLAVSRRADLRAAQRDLASLVSALGLTRTFRFVPVLDFGFAGERDIDGALNLGPQFRVELPIFNQGQARLARGRAELRRAMAKYEALAIAIRSDVRKYRGQLARLRDRARFYRDTLLPDRIRIVNRTLLQYNAMQLGPYALFVAKADELRAERGSIDTLRDYWMTRAELERVVGGTLTPAPAAEKSREPNQ